MKNLVFWSVFMILHTIVPVSVSGASPSAMAPCLPYHPLHLSVTNITYENGKLNIRMKTFRDDWEVAYFHYHSQIIDLRQEENRQIPWFSDYLFNRFRISAGKETPPYPLLIKKVVIEEDAMTIEMEAEVPLMPNSLYLYHSLLTDIYPDQSNLVIFGFEKRHTGIKFDMKKHDAEVMLNG